MNWIRKMRKARLMTQGDLAKIIGVSVASVSNWERGAVSVSDETTSLLRLVLGNHR